MIAVHKECFPENQNDRINIDTKVWFLNSISLNLKLFKDQTSWLLMCENKRIFENQN